MSSGINSVLSNLNAVVMVTICTLISVPMRLNPRSTINHYQSFKTKYSCYIGMDVHDYLTYIGDPRSLLFQRAAFHTHRQKAVDLNRPYSYSFYQTRTSLH